MSGLNDVEELIHFIRENGDIANFADGCPEELLELAESLLGFTFPPTYRRFVAEFGTCDIAGQEFLGVYQTPAMGDRLLGSVRETLDAREKGGLPDPMLVTMFDGMGGLIVLDTETRDIENESPVLGWNPGAGPPGETEALGPNFGTYSLALCKRAVQGWRDET